MKRALIFLFVLLGMMISVQGRTKKAQKPYYLFSSVSDIVLCHFVRTDTATLLYVKVNKAHNREWALNPELHLVADGKKLAYRDGVFLVKKGKRVERQPFSPGVRNPVVCDTIGGECVYPCDSLLLSFDPLPAGAEEFDFIEGSDRNSYIVLGVRCDGKPYPSLLPRSFSPSVTPDWSAYVPRRAKAVLRGHIYNYRKEMGSFSYFRDEGYTATGENYPFEIKSDSLGNFSYEAELFYPVWIDLYICGSQWQRVLLVPGEELVMDVDMPVFSMNGSSSPNLLGGKGRNPAVRFRGSYAALNEASWSLGRQSDALNPSFEAPFSRYVEDLWKRYQNDLSAIGADQSLDSLHREFRRLLAQRRYLMNRVSYLKKLRWKLNRDRQKSDSLLLKDREQEFTLVDPHAREFDFFDHLKTLFLLSDTTMIGYMEANTLTDSPFYKWSAELSRAQSLATRIRYLQPVTDESAWENIAPQYVEPLRQLNDTVAKRLEAARKKENKARIRATPLVAPGQIIPEIVAQFKGKVVFFDCWATWCVPCRRGIEQMEPMKKELEGKDVVFVYLASEASEMPDWINCLEKIPGEHYCISNAVFGELPGVVSIPQYFIYDRTGKQIFAHRGWNARLLPLFRETLLKALEESSF